MRSGCSSRIQRTLFFRMMAYHAPFRLASEKSWACKIRLPFFQICMRSSPSVGAFVVWKAPLAGAHAGHAKPAPTPNILPHAGPCDGEVIVSGPGRQRVPAYQPAEVISRYLKLIRLCTVCMSKLRRQHGSNDARQEPASLTLCDAANAFVRCLALSQRRVLCAASGWLAGGLVCVCPISVSQLEARFAGCGVWGEAERCVGLRGAPARGLRL